MRTRLNLLFRERLDANMQEVVHGAGVALILRVAAAGFGFLFNVLLARLLGAEGAGIYYLALTVTAVAAVIGRIGLDNALLRFTATHVAMGEWSAVKGLYRKGIGLALFASSLSAAVIIISAPLIAHSIFSEPALVTPLRWIALAIVPTSLLTLHGELLKGLKKIKDAMLVQTTGVPFLGCLMLLIIGSSWGTLGAIFAYTISSTAMLAIALYLWHRAVPETRTVRGKFSGRLLVSTSFPLLIVASMDLVVTLTDTVMLGILGRAADVGVYGVAMRTAMLTSFILISVNTIVAPTFATLFHRGDIRALQDLARSSARLMTILAAPTILLFTLAPGLILRIFGEGFEAGAIALSILAMGQFANVAFGSVGYLLMMSGHEKLMRNNVLGTAALNIVLNLILIPSFGINGAAAATALSLTSQNLIAAVLVYRKLGIISLGIGR